jgi:hypothetical protein
LGRKRKNSGNSRGEKVNKRKIVKNLKSQISKEKVLNHYNNSNIKHKQFQHQIYLKTFKFNL